MTKVFWFSRHNMTAEQLTALTTKLGEIKVTKVNGTAANVHVPFMGTYNDSKEEVELPSLKEQVTEFDVIAIVAPIGLQQQFLTVTNGKPVIMAKSKRVTIKNENGDEDKIEFVFEKWEQLKKIDIVVEDFI